MKHISKIKILSDESPVFEPEYVIPFDNDDISWNSNNNALTISCIVPDSVYNSNYLLLYLKYVGKGYTSSSTVTHPYANYKINVKLIRNDGAYRVTNSNFAKLPADDLDCSQFSGQSVTWGYVVFKYGDIIQFNCTGINGSLNDVTKFIECHPYSYTPYVPFFDGTSSVEQRYFHKEHEYFAAFVYNGANTFSSGVEYTISVPCYESGGIFFNDTEVMLFNNISHTITRITGYINELSSTVLEIKFKPTSNISNIGKIAFKCRLVLGR